MYKYCCKINKIYLYIEKAMKRAVDRTLPIQRDSGMCKLSGNPAESALEPYGT